MFSDAFAIVGTLMLAVALVDLILVSFGMSGFSFPLLDVLFGEDSFLFAQFKDPVESANEIWIETQWANFAYYILYTHPNTRFIYNQSIDSNLRRIYMYIQDSLLCITQLLLLQQLQLMIGSFSFLRGRSSFSLTFSDSNSKKAYRRIVDRRWLIISISR